MAVTALLVALVGAIAGCSEAKVPAIPLGGLPAQSEDLYRAVLLAGSAGALSVTPDQYLNPEARLVSSVLYDNAFVRFAPEPRAAPWYRVEILPAGRSFSERLASGAPQAEVSALTIRPEECWDEAPERLCAGIATTTLKPTADISGVLELGPLPPLDQRFVLRRTAEGVWKVDNGAALRAQIQGALKQHLENAILRQERTHLPQIIADREAAVQGAYNQIFETLSARLWPNDDGTITLVERKVQIARQPVGGSSFLDIMRACRVLSIGGHTNWQLASREDIRALGTVRANDSKTVDLSDTPDNRIWGSVLAEQLPVGTTVVTDSFYEMGRNGPSFSVGALPNRRAMFVSAVFNVRTPAQGGGFREDMTYSSAGYWTLQNLSARWSGTPRAGLCVRQML